MVLNKKIINKWIFIVVRLLIQVTHVRRYSWGHKKEERKILRASTSRVLTPRLGLEVSGIWHEMIYDLDD